jgi:hypothetical protein
VPPD